jgi:hypothetical protein
MLLFTASLVAKSTYFVKDFIYLTSGVILSLKSIWLSAQAPCISFTFEQYKISLSRLREGAKTQAPVTRSILDAYFFEMKRLEVKVIEMTSFKIAIVGTAGRSTEPGDHQSIPTYV